MVPEGAMLAAQVTSLQERRLLRGTTALEHADADAP